MEYDKIKKASSDEIEKYDDIVAEFLHKIYDIDRYMVTDGSHLSDFQDLLEEKIIEEFGIDFSGLENPNSLLEVVKKIHATRDKNTQTNP